MVELVLIVGFACVTDIIQNFRESVYIARLQNVAVSQEIVAEELFDLRELVFPLSLRRAAILLDVVSEEEPEDDEINNDLDV